jgi:Short repeat of unknown function (DUF308)
MKVILFILISFVAVTAFICGLIMVSNPDGKALGLDIILLKDTPFKDFLIPGLFLTIVGIVNLIAVFFNIRRHNNRYDWALASGIIICGWIVVQIIFIQILYWPQFLYLAIGALIILVAYGLKGKWAV